MDREHERTPTLHEVQAWMAAAIVGGTPPALLPFIDTRRGVDVTERLAVYANGYPARIHEALREQFPALAHIVGESAFAQLVGRYIAAVPLRSYYLNDAGVGVPLFVGTDRLATQLPFLSDLALLESRVCRAFHAYDEAALDARSLADWTSEQWERAVVRFQPWVAVLMSDWPVREIWECRETPIELIDIDINDHPECVLVCRAAEVVVCEAVTRGEGEALAMLLAGQRLGEVMATVAERGHDPAAVSTWFAHWMARRAVTGLEQA
jgi:hypothetical protein